MEQYSKVRHAELYPRFNSRDLAKCPFINMAFNLSPEDKAFWEALLEKAEPYSNDDPELSTLDGDYDPKRMMATLAKRALDGKLR